MIQLSTAFLKCLFEFGSVLIRKSKKEIKPKMGKQKRQIYRPEFKANEFRTSLLGFSSLRASKIKNNIVVVTTITPVVT